MTKKLSFWKFWRKNHAYRHLLTLPVFVGAVPVFMKSQEPDVVQSNLAFYLIAFLILTLLVLLATYLDWKGDN